MQITHSAATATIATKQRGANRGNDGHLPATGTDSSRSFGTAGTGRAIRQAAGKAEHAATDDPRCTRRLPSLREKLPSFCHYNADQWLQHSSKRPQSQCRRNPRIACLVPLFLSSITSRYDRSRSRMIRLRRVKRRHVSGVHLLSSISFLSSSFFHHIETRPVEVQNDSLGRREKTACFSLPVAP